MARIKKIMKTDDDVRMISIEAPILFSKACELFVMDLAFKALFYAKSRKHQRIDKLDLALAATESETHDFLIDLVAEEDMEEVNKVRDVTAYQMKLYRDLIKVRAAETNSTCSIPTSFGLDRSSFPPEWDSGGSEGKVETKSKKGQLAEKVIQMLEL